MTTASTAPLPDPYRPDANFGSRWHAERAIASVFVDDFAAALAEPEDPAEGEGIKWVVYRTAQDEHGRELRQYLTWHIEMYPCCRGKKVTPDVCAFCYRGNKSIGLFSHDVADAQLFKDKKDAALNRGYLYCNGTPEARDYTLAKVIVKATRDEYEAIAVRPHGSESGAIVGLVAARPYLLVDGCSLDVCPLDRVDLAIKFSKGAAWSHIRAMRDRGEDTELLSVQTVIRSRRE